MSPYKIPCGTILEHFLRQNTLYESAVSGHLYFYSTPFFHAFSSRLFFHRDRSKIGPRESGLPPRIPFGRIAQIRETNRFCLASIFKYTHARREFWRKSSIFVLLLYNKGVSPVTGKRTFAAGGYR